MASFKRLIQRRSAIEILCVAVLTCSNSFDDFGTHIYGSGDEGSSDLSSIVQEDYICLSPTGLSPPATTSGMPFDVPRTADVRLIQSADVVSTNMSVEMVGTEGEKMIDIVSMSLHYALMELENVHTLIYYMISYPMSFLPCYEFGFQKLIINTFTNVINKLTSKSFEPVLMLHIADLVTYLIPLVRANLLFDAVLFDVFKLSITLTRIAIDVPYSNSQDRVRAVIKEIGSTARFFSFACINKHFERSMRNAVFAIIHENLDILLHPALEDIADMGLQATGGVMFPRRAGAETGVGTGNAAVLEAVQALGAGLGNIKKISVWSLPFVKADRNRISQVFWIYMTNACYSMVLEDDTAVRIEATRILAYLSVHRGSLMEQVLGNFTAIVPGSRLWMSNNTETPEETALKAAKEVDIFRDGFSKLVPDASGRYEIFLRGATDDNESEENRFADFSFWISDNNVKCDKIFYAIDSALQWTVPSAQEVEEIRRQLEYVSANNSANGLVAIQNNAKGKDHIDAVKNALAASDRLSRAEGCSKQRDQIVLKLHRFETFGLSSLASGACGWGSTWSAVQSGPIWGYLPLRELRRDRGQEDAPTVGTCCRYFGADQEEEAEHITGFRKAWYLNSTEGPERVRRKLEQDFSVPLLMSKNQKKESLGVRRASLFLDDRTTSTDSPAQLTEDGAAKVSPEEEGMEGFLKKIAKEGLIKRVGSDVYFEKDETEEETYLALEGGVDGVDGGDIAVMETPQRQSESHRRPSGTNRRPSGSNRLVMEEVDTADSVEMERDLAMELAVPSADRDGAAQKDRFVAPEATIDEEEEENQDPDGEHNRQLSPGGNNTLYGSVKVENEERPVESTVESNKLRRSAILVEIVKGVIGAAEWAKASLYNVKRYVSDPFVMMYCYFCPY
jgi:hypothetical protein